MATLPALTTGTPAATITTTPATAAPATALPPVSIAPVVLPSGAPSPSGAAAGTALPVGQPPTDTAVSLPNAWVQRAVALYLEGKNEPALAEYRKGIANDPTDFYTWFGLAELLHELGREQQAMETYALSLEGIEHAPELRLPYAELLILNKKRAEAIKVLQKGIELDPDASTEMKAMLGKILIGALDSTTVADTRAASPTSEITEAATEAKAPIEKGTKKSKPKAQRRTQKKLCKLFCPGAFDKTAPKPRG